MQARGGMAWHSRTEGIRREALSADPSPSNPQSNPQNFPSSPQIPKLPSPPPCPITISLPIANHPILLSLVYSCFHSVCEHNRHYIHTKNSQDNLFVWHAIAVVFTNAMNRRVYGAYHVYLSLKLYNLHYCIPFQPTTNPTTFPPTNFPPHKKSHTQAHPPTTTRAIRYRYDKADKPSLAPSTPSLFPLPLPDERADHRGRNKLAALTSARSITFSAPTQLPGG
ncbi:hypothetical protein P167DRAFT_266718 [Morchella conica CCBAS932]|uniref:Uncharacterized protein n=1 Tax=Morchella conica CCBAS932 TaxID=1392247 RepID=A0A3N4L1L1_9PEZI|nr:hypothetical protein P167DRAFT_266718 [Morchella conica CCBAS932]